MCAAALAGPSKVGPMTTICPSTVSALNLVNQRSSTIASRPSGTTTCSPLPRDQIPIRSSSRKVSWGHSVTSVEELIDGKAPAGYGRFRFGDFAMPIHRRMLRIIRAVHADQVLAKHVYIPDHLRPQSEIAPTISRHTPF